MRLIRYTLSFCLLVTSSLCAASLSAAQDDLALPASRGELAAFAFSDFFPNTRYVAFLDGAFRIFYVGAGSEDPPDTEDGYIEIAERSCEAQRQELQAEAGASDSPPGAGYRAADFLAARLGYSVDDMAAVLTVACVLPINSPDQDERICTSPLYGARSASTASSAARLASA